MSDFAKSVAIDAAARRAWRLHLLRLFLVSWGGALAFLVALYLLAVWMFS